MTHFQVRLEKDIEHIRNGVIAIAKGAERGLENAITALLTLDSDLAYRTIIEDNPINRQAEEVDRLCHYFVARHLPSAGHLRFISSVLRMNVELERIGDYAANIAREAATIQHPIEDPIRGEIERMAKDSLRMYRYALAAFAEGNEEAARATMKSAKAVVVEFETIYEDLVREGGSAGTPVKDLLSKLIVIYMLERVSAQSKNLCEEVVFALTGDRKKRRPVKVLFLESGANSAAQIAVAIGNKAFPESGIYHSVGLANKPIDDALISFMDETGHGLERQPETRLDLDSINWRDYDVLVCLDGPVSTFVKVVPVGTVAFEWPIVDPSAQGDAHPGSERLREMYREIADRLEDLMETMRGGLAEDDHHG
jgi:phosphate transport system protein